MRRDHGALSRLMRFLFLTAVVTTLPAHSAYQSPSTLVSQFAGLFGAGRTALLVWQRQANTALPESYSGSAVNEIMKMDCSTGNAEILVGKTLNVYKSDPTFTWDGKRVVYYVQPADQIRIVNWDGTNDRLLLSGYNGAGHCWRSPAGKDYVLACTVVGQPDQVNPRKICKINVDDTTDKTIICTTTWNTTSAEEGNFAMQWVSMSADGKYLGGGFPTYSQLAVFALDANGQVTPQVANNGYGSWLTKINTAAQGCWPTMARDNTGDILATVGEHQQAVVATWDDKSKSTWNTPIGMYECLRWTPDRNFLTCIKCCTAGVPGPYIIRMSDNKNVYLNSSLSTLEGNMDVFFYNTVSTVTPHSAMNVRGAAGAGQMPKLYDSRGRAISGMQTSGLGARAVIRMTDPERGGVLVVLGAGR